MTEAKLDLDKAIAALQNQLQGSGISTAEWGKGAAKTLRHLVLEIERGECTLLKVEGSLIRTVVVAGADVFYDSPVGHRYRLIEDYQMFADGRKRRRELAQSVSEKMRPNEDPKDAIVRGIGEELGIRGDIAISYQGETQRTLPSPSYPGLISRYCSHSFTVFLQDAQFKSEGYVERQLDKSTHFVWQLISKDSP